MSDGYRVLTGWMTVLLAAVAAQGQINAIDFLDNQIVLDFDGRYTGSQLLIELTEGAVLNPDGLVEPLGVPDDTFVAVGVPDLSNGSPSIIGHAADLTNDSETSIEGGTFNLAWGIFPSTNTTSQTDFLSAQIELTPDARGSFRYLASAEGSISWVDSDVSNGLLIGAPFTVGQPPKPDPPSPYPDGYPYGPSPKISDLSFERVADHSFQLKADFEGFFIGAEILVELYQGEVVNYDSSVFASYSGQLDATFIGPGLSFTDAGNLNGSVAADVLGGAETLGSTVPSTRGSTFSLAFAYDATRGVQLLTDQEDFLVAQLSFTPDAEGWIQFLPSTDGSGQPRLYYVYDGQIDRGGIPEPSVACIAGLMLFIGSTRRLRRR